MTTDLQHITFADTALEVVPDPDERTWWVSLRRACEGIGIKFTSQRTKLEGTAWATMTTVDTVAADGRRRQMLMIDRATLIGWLATISPGRVSEEARPKVERYQAECVRVLDEHFFGDQTPTPEPAPQRIEPPDTARLAEHVIEHPDGTTETRRYIAGEPAQPARPATDHTGHLRQLKAAITEIPVERLRRAFRDGLRDALRSRAADFGRDGRGAIYRYHNRLLAQHVGKSREQWTRQDYTDAVRWLDDQHDIDLWAIFDEEAA